MTREPAMPTMAHFGNRSGAGATAPERSQFQCCKHVA